MGRLKDFRAYLEGRHAVLSDAEQRLCVLQAKYESYFAEVARVREAELGQLVALTLADRSGLPPWFNQEVDRVRVAVEAELDAKLAELTAAAADAAGQAEAERRASLAAEERVRASNLSLDREEEALKARTASLLARIDDINGRIGELGHGFGFFANFFGMRRIARDKAALEKERDDLAARIDAFRARWQREEADHAAAEVEHRRLWLEHGNRAAALTAKVEALREARPAMVARTTVERVLVGRRRDDAPATGASVACSRCQTANPAGRHFCQICARRLGEDRPDFAGSVDEIAEVNDHFERFAAGMKAGQEVVGLVRGLSSGVEAFTASIDDVLASEKKYPLPKLEIDVPAASTAFGTTFDRLRELVARDLSVHPTEFAAAITELVARELGEEQIKGWFEGMGAELTRQADSQWKK